MIAALSSIPESDRKKATEIAPQAASLFIMKCKCKRLMTSSLRTTRPDYKITLDDNKGARLLGLPLVLACECRGLIGFVILFRLPAFASFSTIRKMNQIECRIRQRFWVRLDEMDSTLVSTTRKALPYTLGKEDQICISKSIAKKKPRRRAEFRDDGFCYYGTMDA